MGKFNFINIIKKHYSAFYNAGIGDENHRCIDKLSVFFYHLWPFIGLLLIIGYWFYNTYHNYNCFLCEKFFLVAMIDSDFISSIITTVSIFAPLLFSTLVLMFDMYNQFKNQDCDSSNIVTREKKILNNKIIVTKEMFAHICFSILLCIIILLCSLLYLIVTSTVILFIIISFDIYMILLFFETLFMIMKRLFNLIDSQ